MRPFAALGSMFGQIAGGAVAGYRAASTASTTSSGGGYAGGRSDRRNDLWGPSNAGPNAAADLTLEQLRNRCRDLGRNHPQLSGAVNAIVTSVVGAAGIRVRPQTEWPDLNERIRAYMRDHHTYVDPGREQTERMYQCQLVAELILVGELLTHFAVAPEWRDHPAGPCMESIVAERLDVGLNQNNGENFIRQGIEFDSFGRVVKYHVYKRHPNDGIFIMAIPMAGNRSLMEIPASECSLAILRRAAGQIRGVPLAGPVVHELAFGKKVKDAALMSALTQSCFGLTVIGGSPDKLREKIGDHSGLINADGEPVRRLSPGQVMYVPRGVEVKANGPTLPGAALESMTQVVDRENAAALGQDIAGYSKDFGRATFSAIRADKLQVNAHYRSWQQLVYELEAEPWYQVKLSWGIASGEIELTPEQAEAWADIHQRARIRRSSGQFPGFGWVDPRQEATAADVAIKAGIRSRPDLIAEQGDDPEETLREQIAFEKLEHDLRAEAGLPTGPAAPAVNPAVPAEDRRDPDDENDDDDEGDPDAFATTRRAKAGAATHTNGVARHA